MKNAFSWDFVFPAPAKINLFLHVVGKNQKGYHLLETCFRLINWCDFLRFEKHSKVVFPQAISGISEENNLCLKAAHALKDATGFDGGCAIFLEKNLPMGSGLGGGSSDAASVLMALNCLWQTKLSRQNLMKIAQTLGADVPFFVFGQNAFGRGIGEILSVQHLPKRFYLLATPNVHCPTPQIFASPNLCRNTPKLNENWTLDSTHNDLQAVALDLYPALKPVWENLQKRTSHARMTGSGSAFFAEFQSQEEAQSALEQFNACPARVVEGLNEHPLNGCF